MKKKISHARLSEKIKSLEIIRMGKCVVWDFKYRTDVFYGRFRYKGYELLKLIFLNNNLK